MEKKTLDLLEGLGTDQDSSIAVSIPWSFETGIHTL
jgi:hypothetical protein